MQVKRAQWIGDVMGEPRVFGLPLRTIPASGTAWRSTRRRGIIEDAKAKTLAAVGEDIGEANESKEKVEIAKVTMTDEDRKISVDGNGVITIPAAATSKPTKSTGKIIFMDSNLGGKQLHYSRTGGHQEFEYTFDAPAAGKYALTARVVTPSWKQSLLLTVNGAKQADRDRAAPHRRHVGHRPSRSSSNWSKARTSCASRASGERQGSHHQGLHPDPGGIWRGEPRSQEALISSRWLARILPPQPFNRGRRCRADRNSRCRSRNRASYVSVGRATNRGGEGAFLGCGLRFLSG